MDQEGVYFKIIPPDPQTAKYRKSNVRKVTINNKGQLETEYTIL